MKTSSMQRWLFEVINFLLVLSFLVPLSVLLGWLFKYDGSWILWVLCLAALGHLAGRLTMHSDAVSAQAACYATAAVAAAAVGLIAIRLGGGFTAHTVGNLLYIVVALVCSIFFFFSARKAHYTIYAPMSIVGILLHLLTLLVLYAAKSPELYRTVCSWAAIIFFLLSLYAFNAQGLRKSVHTHENARAARLPRGIQMSSFLYVTGFILLATLLSFFGPAIPALGAFVGKLIMLLLKGFNWLISIFDNDRRIPTAMDESDSKDSEGLGMLDDIVAKGEAAWVTNLVNAFAMLIVGILLIVLLVLFYRKFLKGLKGIQALLNRMRQAFEPVNDEDYVDETESLFSWKEAMQNAAANLRGTLQKLTDRPQKFSDFQTGTMKIRFVYQQLLQRRQEEDGGAMSRYETPNELSAHLRPEAREFIESYNAVRYAAQEPSDEQLEQAKVLLQKHS